MATPRRFTKKIKYIRSNRAFISSGILEVDALLVCPERRTHGMSINKDRPIVYICSPYAGDIEANVTAARRYSRFAVDAGYIPVAPHLLFPQFLDDTNPKERELGLCFGNTLMSKCSEVWVFGNRISEGMKAEISLAKQENYCLHYFTEECQEV
jgi:hypothetical protein